jgi:peroxiredoxin Q/BCP
MLFRILSSMMVAHALKVNDSVPAIEAKNQDGKTIKLEELKGHFVLYYFYPADDTPVCTKEACSLRDNFDEIKKLNALVFGISRQDEKSHKQFIARHKLPFDLLVDRDGVVSKAFGVSAMLGYNHRSSFLANPEGKIIKTYPNVDPGKHAAEILADLKAAQR